MDIQLRVQVLMRNAVQYGRRLIGTTRRLGLFNSHGVLGLHRLRQAMLLIGKHTIGQLHALSEATRQHLTQQAHIVLLQIFVHVHARYLYAESPAVVVVLLEDDRREPGPILLLGDVFLNQSKAVVPKRLWIIYHAALLVFLFYVREDLCGLSVIVFVCKGTSFFAIKQILLFHTSNGL